MHADRINATVRACLDRCYESDNASACIAAFMHELRASGQWSERDLSAVYSTVLRVLRGLCSAADQCDADQASLSAQAQ
jgi:hypothetical protein